MFSELGLWNDGDLHSVYLGTNTSSITLMFIVQNFAHRDCGWIVF